MFSSRSTSRIKEGTWDQRDTRCASIYTTRLVPWAPPAERKSTYLCTWCICTCESINYHVEYGPRLPVSALRAKTHHNLGMTISLALLLCCHPLLSSLIRAWTHTYTDERTWIIYKFMYTLYLDPLQTYTDARTHDILYHMTQITSIVSELRCVWNSYCGWDLVQTWDVHMYGPQG